MALPPTARCSTCPAGKHIIDDQGGLKEPVGIAGVRLEAKVHIVTSQVSAAQNLVKCCKQAGLTVDDVVLRRVASADAVLTTSEEKDLGVALVDVGGGTTDVVIFHGGAVRHTAGLPLGGLPLPTTSPPASAPRRPRPRRSSNVSDVPGPRSSSATPDRGPERRRPRSACFSGHILCEIIEPRASRRSSRWWRARSSARGTKRSWPPGSSCVGGTVLLDHITDVAEHVLRPPVRIGVPHHVLALADLVASPIHATLDRASARRRQRRADRCDCMRDAPMSCSVAFAIVHGEWLRDFSESARPSIVVTRRETA